MFALAPLWIALSLAFADGDAVVPGFQQSTVATGFSNPTAIGFLPDGRILVTEQGGALKLVDNGAVTTLIDIPVAMCFDYETGLLGIVVDPDFANNGYVYLYRTKLGTFDCFDPNQRFNEIVRIVIGANNTVDIGSLTVLLTGIETDTGYHDGGALRLGPDGHLYAGTGETGQGDFGGGAPGTSTNTHAQSLDALEGKILRVARDGSIPNDNPFVGVQGARAEIYAFGFRNPWRMAFDPIGGGLWVGDVGENDMEEVDLVMPGANYGWPLSEGKLPKVAPGTVAPVLTYLHEGTKSLGSCVSGVGFAPPGFGYFGGFLFFGDFDGEHIYRVALDKTRKKAVGSPVIFANNTDGITDLVFGPDGALYYLSLNAGALRKIAPPAGGGEQQVAGKSLALKFNDKAKNKFSVAAQVAAAIDLGAGFDSPVDFGGSLRMRGNGFDQTFALPAARWKLLGKVPDKVTGFQYSAAASDVTSSIKLVQVRAGKSLKITGTGNDFLYDLGLDPGPVHIDLILGNRKFCMEFGGTTKLTAGKQFTAKDAPAPASCPP